MFEGRVFTTPTEVDVRRTRGLEKEPGARRDQRPSSARRTPHPPPFNAPGRSSTQLCVASRSGGQAPPNRRLGGRRRAHEVHRRPTLRRLRRSPPRLRPHPLRRLPPRPPARCAGPGACTHPEKYRGRKGGCGDRAFGAPGHAVSHKGRLSIRTTPQCLGEGVLQASFYAVKAGVPRYVTVFARSAFASCLLASRVLSVRKSTSIAVEPSDATGP
jgi:hypothetical protein